MGQATEDGLPLASRRTIPPLHAIGKRISVPALVAQLIWGLNVTTLKITITELDPFIVGFLRTLIAGLILLVILWRTEGAIGFKSYHCPRMMAVAFLGFGINTSFWQLGLSLSTASDAALISSSAPLFALVLAVAIGQETLAPRRVAGMFLALVGVVVIIQAGGIDTQRSTLIGALFLLASQVTWASYNVLAVPLLRHYSPLRITTWAMLLGSVVLVALSPLGVRSWDMTRGSLAAWGGLVYAILLGSVVAHSFWTRSVRNMGAGATMIYSYLSPVLAVGFAALLIGDRLDIAQGLGAVCVLAGVTLGVRRQSRAE